MRALVTSLPFVVLVSGCFEGEAEAPARLVELERRVDALERATRADADDAHARGERTRRAEAKDGSGRRGDAKADAAAGPVGRVEISGDATKVALRGDGRRIDLPGDVPAGKYLLVARFGDATVELGGLEVEAGRTLHLACSAHSKRCLQR